MAPGIVRVQYSRGFLAWIYRLPGAGKGEKALLGDSNEVGCGFSIGLTEFSSTFEFTILSQSGAILNWNLTFSDPEPISLSTLIDCRCFLCEVIELLYLAGCFCGL
jgi:hypothetical protein